MPIVTTPGRNAQGQSVSLPTTPQSTSLPTVSQLTEQPVITQPQQPSMPIATPVASQMPSSRLQSMVPQRQFQPPAQPTKVDLDDDADFSLENFDSDDADGFDNPLPTFSAQANQPSNGSKSQSLSRMTEDDRRKVISEIFQLVLGKEPTDRDFSYYRFSTLTEESLTKSLLTLPEHKQLVDKAREHTSLKQSMSDLDIRSKQMESSISSMQQELYTLQQLLVEKNRYIQQMRGIPEERQAQPLPPQQFAPQVQQPEQMQAPVASPAPVSSGVEIKTLPGPMDEMKSMFKSLFSGKK